MAEQNAVPDQPTQQVVNRCVKCLANDVVEGHIHAGFRRFGAVEQAVHQGVSFCNTERIPARKGFCKQIVDIFGLTPALAVPDAADFANPGNALIGLDFNNRVFRFLAAPKTAGKGLRARYADRGGLYAGNLQTVLLSVARICPCFPGRRCHRDGVPSMARWDYSYGSKNVRSAPKLSIATTSSPRRLARI